MRVLFALLLRAFHFIYAIILNVRSFWRRSSIPPQSLKSLRRRIPKHLAIVFVTNSTTYSETVQDVLSMSVLNAVEWCQSIGIAKLSVYEERDMLSSCTQQIRESLPIHGQEYDCTESEADYPLTPPPSDYSESRPLSPTHNHGAAVPLMTFHVAESVPQKSRNSQLKSVNRSKQADRNHRHDLLLCFLSRDSSKDAIATVAQDFARAKWCRKRKNSRSSKLDVYNLSVDELEQTLEDENGLSSPDFMIIHPIDSFYTYSAPAELHGFPPWHIRLTEIFVTEPRIRNLQSWFQWRTSPRPSSLDEDTFREALDEFSSAEMRFGK